jgi:hypothetical protein
MRSSAGQQQHQPTDSATRIKVTHSGPWGEAIGPACAPDKGVTLWGEAIGLWGEAMRLHPLPWGKAIENY